MQLLSKFRKTSRIRMLRTVIKVRICCEVVFYEELIAVFKLKKSQIGNEIDKDPKFSTFRRFFAVFFQNYDRRRGLER